MSLCVRVYISDGDGGDDDDYCDDCDDSSEFL